LVGSVTSGGFPEVIRDVILGIISTIDPV
jgi:hypothetical protein